MVYYIASSLYGLDNYDAGFSNQSTIYYIKDNGWPSSWTTAERKIKSITVEDGTGWWSTNDGWNVEIAPDGYNVKVTGVCCVNVLITTSKGSRRFSFQQDGIILSNEFNLSTNPDGHVMYVGDTYQARLALDVYTFTGSTSSEVPWVISDGQRPLATTSSIYNMDGSMVYSCTAPGLYNSTVSASSTAETTTDVIELAGSYGVKGLKAGTAWQHCFVQLYSVTDKYGNVDNYWSIAWPSLKYTIREKETDPTCSIYNDGAQSATVGDTVANHFTVYCTGGDGKWYTTYYSTDLTVADINSDGTVNAKAAGTCKIQAFVWATTTGHCIGSSSYELTVSAKPDPGPGPTPTPTWSGSIAADKSSIELKSGNTVSAKSLFTVTADDSDYSVTYTVSGNLTISGNTVTAGKVGTGKITAELFHDSKSYGTATVTVKVVTIIKRLERGAGKEYRLYLTDGTKVPMVKSGSIWIALGEDYHGLLIGDRIKMTVGKDVQYMMYYENRRYWSRVGD